MFTTVEFFPSSKIMANVRNRRMLAAVSSELQLSARKSQSQRTFVPVITEEYVTRVSEESEKQGH